MQKRDSLRDFCLCDGLGAFRLPAAPSASRRLLSISRRIPNGRFLYPQPARMPHSVDAMLDPESDAPVLEETFLLTHDVAQLLRCSVRTVHELTRQRAIPHRK